VGGDERCISQRQRKMILTNDLTQKTKVLLSNKNFQNRIEMLNQVQHDKKKGTIIVVIPNWFRDLCFGSKSFRF
jgi:flagellar motor switch protein FliG